MENKTWRIKEFLSQRSLLRSLVIKNLRNRYSNTLIGFLWTIVTPLLISLVISFVFTYIMQVKIDNFVIYVISGMLPWICFASSLQESSTSLIENAGLWKQFRVPLEFIPTSCVIINFLNLIIGLTVALAFFIKSSPKVILYFLLVPIPLTLHFIFTLGISFLLSSLYVRRKDIAYFLNILLIFWLWSSPIFYLLDRFPLHIQRMSNLNIMIPFLNLYRDIFYKHALFDLKDLTLAVCLSLSSFIYGYLFFVKQEDLIKKSL
jgi:lipopolysaccharide transport system permease protein